MPSKKKSPAKKAVKKAVKETVAKKAPAPKARVAQDAAAKDATTPANPLRQTVVSRTGAAADKKSTPIVFSLDDIEELMAAKKAAPAQEEPTAPQKAAVQPKVQPTKKIIVDDKPVEKRVLGAASLADILGFNPAEKKSSTELGDSEVPKKWKKYYALLIALRAHVSDEITLHTSETLKHSARDESGSSSSYGNHDTDTGTDSFDRDFALSLVSNEQDALNEVEEAILRIKDGSYAVCEITGHPIPAARLTVVPFARYSVEGQAEHERNQRRKSNRMAAGGIFGDAADTPKLESSDDDE